MPNKPGGVTRLIEGVAHFQQQVFGTKEGLFRKLGEGQSPAVLFITCSDSRINPNLLTLTEPGELFILRNAGNIVPVYGGAPTGEAATIEYAVKALKVHDVVICGHAKCGAVQGLLNPGALSELPAVKGWLGHAKGVAEETDRQAAGKSPEDRLNLAVEQNVLRQLGNLKTHPAITEALAEGKLRVHGWVYRFESGDVMALDATSNKFVPLAEAPKQPIGGKQPAGNEPFGGMI
jgi:carbonic anhydrase